MNHFIGDLHLFNRNQTGEGVNYDGRPFATVAEMNQYILEHWNAKITNGDIVQSETKNNYFTERTQHHEDHFFRYLLYERMAGYLPV